MDLLIVHTKTSVTRKIAPVRTRLMAVIMVALTRTRLVAKSASAHMVQKEIQQAVRTRLSANKNEHYRYIEEPDHDPIYTVSRQRPPFGIFVGGNPTQYPKWLDNLIKLAAVISLGYLRVP